MPTTDIEAVTDRCNNTNHGNNTDSPTANGAPHRDCEVEVITNGDVSKNSWKNRGKTTFDITVIYGAISGRVHARCYPTPERPHTYLIRSTTLGTTAEIKPGELAQNLGYGHYYLSIIYCVSNFV